MAPPDQLAAMIAAAFGPGLSVAASHGRHRRERAPCLRGCEAPRHQRVNGLNRAPPGPVASGSPKRASRLPQVRLESPALGIQSQPHWIESWNPFFAQNGSSLMRLGAGRWLRSIGPRSR
jgi:hypothetical protein